MTYEKVSVLLNAAPKFCGRWEVTLVCFCEQATLSITSVKLGAIGIWDKCYFTGFMSDDPLNKFQTIADRTRFSEFLRAVGISFKLRLRVLSWFRILAVSESCNMQN